MSKELSVLDLARLAVGEVVVDGMGDRWEKRQDCSWQALRLAEGEDPYSLNSTDLVKVWSPIKLDPSSDPEGKQLVQDILNRKESSK